MSVTQRPNFLFIGPDKTGSSWMFEILRDHPEAFVPVVKDLYFFDRYYGRGLEWYWSFFADAPATARAVGELSHDYLFSPEAAGRIARDLPGVRLMTSLRDPVERSFSHYLYMIRSGRTRASFADALAEFPELVDKSLYAHHLKAYYDLFDTSRIKVLMFEDLRADAQAYAREMFDFLGLGFDPAIEYDRQVLPASRPRSFLVARLAKQGAEAARSLGLAGLVGRIKHSRVAQSLYAPYSAKDKPRMDPAVGERLRARFAPDVERLQGLIGRDLSHWLPGGAVHAR